MLLDLVKTNGSPIALNSEQIWKVVATIGGGSSVYVGAKKYSLSTPYAEVLALAAGVFVEYTYTTGVRVQTFSLNKNVIARVSNEYGRTFVFLKNGDKIQVDQAFEDVIEDNEGGGSGETIIEHTVAEMQELAATEGFTVGQLYKITGYTDAGTILFFRAATTSKLETDGMRVMLCPAFYDTGGNNGDGNNWIGVWNENRLPSPNDLTIWGGKVWRNLTGDVGGADNENALDATNWVLIPKASYTNSEYTELIFGCRYDLENDWIEKQWDDAGNMFGMDFNTEQDWWEFGFNTCDVSDWNYATSGHVFANNICLGIWNNSCESIVDNALDSGGYIRNNSNNGDIRNNSNNGDIANNINNGDIRYNSNNGGIGNNSNDGNINNNINNGGIYNNSNDGGISNNSNNGEIGNNSNDGGISNNSNNGNIESCSSGEYSCNIFQNNHNGGITGTFDADVTEYGAVDLELDSAPATGTASGVTTTFTANEGQAFGDAVFINNASKAQLGDATAIATASCIAICTGSVSADATGTYLLHGFASNNSWNWTVGGLIYLSLTGATGNTLTQTPPSATDEVVQVLGVATHANRIFFNPQLMQIEKE